MMVENHEHCNCNGKDNTDSRTTCVRNVAIHSSKERIIMPGNSVYCLFFHYEDLEVSAFF